MKNLPLIHACLLAAAILSVSCERQKQLLREKERIDAEIQQAYDESQSLEHRMLALGSQVATAAVNLERQVALADQKAAMIESEISVLESKLKALEDASMEFGPKVDGYKAKYLR